MTLSGLAPNGYRALELVRLPASCVTPGSDGAGDFCCRCGAAWLALCWSGPYPRAPGKLDRPPAQFRRQPLRSNFREKSALGFWVARGGRGRDAAGISGLTRQLVWSRVSCLRGLVASLLPNVRERTRPTGPISVLARRPGRPSRRGSTIHSHRGPSLRICHFAPARACRPTADRAAAAVCRSSLRPQHYCARARLRSRSG